MSRIPGKINLPGALKLKYYLNLLKFLFDRGFNLW